MIINEIYNLSEGQNIILIEATSNKNKKKQSIKRHILFIPPTVMTESEATSDTTKNP